MRCKALGGRLYQIWTCAWLCLAGPLFQVLPSGFYATHKKNSFWTLWASLLHGTHVVWPQGLNIWALYTPVLGSSHFLWEPDRSGSYILLSESDGFSYIYIYIGLVRTDRFSGFLFFPNSLGSQIGQFLHIW
jgi:hypothetical protein